MRGLAGEGTLATGSAGYILSKLAAEVCGVIHDTKRFCER
jgi:hypothetical protein